MTTPLQTIRQSLRRAEMLVEEVRHSWTFRGVTMEKVYVGTITCLTPAAADMLGEMLDEMRTLNFTSGRVVHLECPINEEEKRWVNAYRGYS